MARHEVRTPQLTDMATHLNYSPISSLHYEHWQLINKLIEQLDQAPDGQTAITSLGPLPSGVFVVAVGETPSELLAETMLAFNAYGYTTSDFVEFILALHGDDMVKSGDETSPPSLEDEPPLKDGDTQPIDDETQATLEETE